MYWQLGTASRYTRIGMLTHLPARAAPNTILRIVRNRFVVDAGVLYARYDLAAVKRSFSAGRLAGRAPTMWRYDVMTEI